MAKKWYLSKTIWLSIISIATMVLVSVQEFVMTGDFSTASQIGLSISILTGINRFFTEKPISL